MQVSVQSSEGLERRLTVIVPAERVETAVQERLKSLARRVKVDGFRPGKVPFSLVQRMYGQQVRFEVQDEVVQSSFRDAVTQQQLRLAGTPRIESSSLEPDKGLEYTAVFEIYPEVGQISLDNIKIEKPVSEVTEADVAVVLERLRKQASEWLAVERPAQDGDRLVLDFTGTIEGEPFAGNEGKEVPVVLGSKTFIAGFEDKLIGAKAGEERTLDLQFPEEYHATELAGKPVQFAIKVISVSEPKLPEVNDEFAQSYGITEGGADALRAEIRGNMQREMEQTIKRKVKQQVLDGLLQANPLTLPRALIDDEIGQLMQQARDDLAARGAQVANINLQPGMFEEHARRRVALGLILAEIIRKNAFKAQPENLRAAVEAAASSYESPAEIINWYYADRRRLAGVEALVLEDQAVDWVLQNVTVSDAPITFEALMQPAQQG